MLIVAAAASCESAPPEAPQKTPSDDLEVYGDLENISPRDQVVVLWYPYIQRREELLLALIDEFNAGNEWNIVVIGEHAGSTDVLFEDLLARIEGRARSGALPGTVIAEQYQIATYAERSALVALNPYVESKQWGYTRRELRDFFPVALAAETLPQFDDRYSWPLYRSMDVLYYNEDRLIELGYTDPPVTWVEFTEMTCAASDPELGTYGYEFAGDDFTFASMLFNRGGRMINEEVTAYAFDGDAGLKSLTSVQWLLKEECAIPATTRSSDRANFVEGKVLFTIDSTSGLPYYRDAVAEGAGFKWSIVPLPTTLETPVVHVHGPGFSIFRATPEKQLAAWLFLKWFTEPEQQARWARAVGTFPVRVSAVELLEDYLAENPQYDRALGFLDHEFAVEPGMVGYSTCRESIERMLATVADAGDPAAWLAITVKECNASLEEAAQH